MKIQKTNAMRLFDAAKIEYDVKTYEVDESDLSGTHVADLIGLPYEKVFKTIVTKGDRTGYTVFCLPCDREIDLKLAAAATQNKRVEPIHLKDLTALTGYIRGGCSPVGMKKKFQTVFDISALEAEKIAISAGVRGMQIYAKTGDILKITTAVCAKITQ